MTDEAKRPMADGMEGFVIVPKIAHGEMLAVADELIEHRITEPQVLIAGLWDNLLGAAPAHPASEAVARLVEALEFYADLSRYEGPNQRADNDDRFSADMAYRLDVTRDGGKIARAALAPFLPKESGE